MQVVIRNALCFEYQSCGWRGSRGNTSPSVLWARLPLVHCMGRNGSHFLISIPKSGVPNAHNRAQSRVLFAVCPDIWHIHLQRAFVLLLVQTPDSLEMSCRSRNDVLTGLEWSLGAAQRRPLVLSFGTKPHRQVPFGLFDCFKVSKPAPLTSHFSCVHSSHYRLCSSYSARELLLHMSLDVLISTLQVVELVPPPLPPFDHV